MELRQREWNIGQRGTVVLPQPDTGRRLKCPVQQGRMQDPPLLVGVRRRKLRQGFVASDTNPADDPVTGTVMETMFERGVVDRVAIHNLRAPSADAHQIKRLRSL